MKYILLIPTFIFSISSVKAQTWCPPGATWHYDVAVLAAGFHKYQYVGDTIISGTSCKEISADYYEFYYQPNGTFQGPSIMDYGSHFSYQTGDTVMHLGSDGQFTSFSTLVQILGTAG